MEIKIITNVTGTYWCKSNTPPYPYSQNVYAVLYCKTYSISIRLRVLLKLHRRQKFKLDSSHMHYEHTL